MSLRLPPSLGAIMVFHEVLIETKEGPVWVLGIVEAEREGELLVAYLNPVKKSGHKDWFSLDKVRTHNENAR